jgi:hypothetical protein
MLETGAREKSMHGVAKLVEQSLHVLRVEGAAVVWNVQHQCHHWQLVSAQIDQPPLDLTHSDSDASPVVNGFGRHIEQLIHFIGNGTSSADLRVVV